MEEEQEAFSVNSYYAFLAKERAERHFQPQERQIYFSTKIWDPAIPFRVAYFVWRVYFGRIQTKDELITRGMDILSGCSMCENGKESVDHLLVYYPLAKKL